ncbi:MAG: hypothetical protein VX252_14735, partial [Myxococcota bacterium]|nr:hypothetical protein [Myxococcota bacterium]
MNQQNQRKNDSPETRTRVVSLILLLGLGVLVGWVLWSPEKSQETSALTDDRSQETLSPQASQVSPTPASQNRGITDFSLREGQEAVIPLADIPAERPLLLNLELADEA